MKKIVIDATDLSHWMGGLYYRKNILFSLLQNEYITKNFRIYVFADQSSRKTFEVFENKILIVNFKYKNTKQLKIKKYLFCIFKRMDFLFPCSSHELKRLGIKAISWIPDFQCNRLPEYFSESEIKSKTEIYDSIAKEKYPLVLSSYDSLNDFRKYYSKDRKNVYVMHFVSYIEKDICNLINNEEQKILKKYNLLGRSYSCVMNQFWKHKNHKTVLEAIKIWVQENPENDFLYAFTGELYDYRNPGYITEIKNLMNDPLIKNHIVLLGLIDRKEQLVIMKHSQYVIQPSLFEGWGTVVEDAKVLDKTILLSDIPVHREQKSSKCILFDPHSPDELAKCITHENLQEHKDDINKGIADMYKRAKEYSCAFESLLKNNI